MKSPIRLLLFLAVSGLLAQERGVGRPERKWVGAHKAFYDESHALVVGISNYKQRKPLPGACLDILRVSESLVRHGFQVTTLFDPTREALTGEVTSFIEKHGQKEDNRLLFYFAGHGATISGGMEGFLIPIGAPAEVKAADAAQYYVSTKWFKRKAREIKAKHSLFLFDSCFSGAIFNHRSGMAVPPDQFVRVYKTSRKVIQYIASGTHKEEVPDDSIFAKKFVEALNGETPLGQSSGYFSVSQLGGWLSLEVLKASLRNHKGPQTPQHGKDGDGDFIFTIPGPTSNSGQRKQQGSFFFR